VYDIEMQDCPNCGTGQLKIIAAILERPVIENVLTHLGLDAQPPPKGRAREADQDFGACAAPALADTSAQAALPSRRRGSAARHVSSTRQESGSTLRSRPKPLLVNARGSAEPGQREGADAEPWQFMPRQPDARA
jgi:hypothetical protein